MASVVVQLAPTFVGIAIASIALATRPAATQLPAQPVQIVTVFVPVVQPPTQPSPAQTPAKTSRAVQVRWGTSWYPGEVLRAWSGPYQLIRFTGYGAEWDTVVHERDLREPGVSVPAVVNEGPGSIPPAGYRTHRGEHISVEWHGRWYPATVRRVLANDTQRIRYDGYGAEWDEDVSLARVRIALDGEPIVPPPEVDAAAGHTPSEQEVLVPGQPLHVRMGPNWRQARMVSMVGPNLALVHYLGYVRAYDEPVPYDRVRVLAAASPETSR
jgi:hypothetical protein